MKKPSVPVRQFVSISPEKGTGSFIVKWTPTPGNRKRSRFADLAAANIEADRIERMMREGNAAVANTPPQLVAQLIMLCKDLPGDVQAHDVLEAYLKTHSPSWETTVTIESAGKEFIKMKENSGLDPRTKQTVRQHITRFITTFGGMKVSALTDPTKIDAYLDNVVGGVGKTRVGHIISIVGFFKWMRDKKKLLPHDRKTVADNIERPKVIKHPKEVFTAEEMMRLLAAAPRELISWYALGGFGGIREEERGQLFWHHWHADAGDDNQIVCEADVTKTGYRRCVPVPANLNAWLLLVKGESDERMEGWEDPLVRSRRHRGGVVWKQNGLRVSFASYHLCLYNNAALTASIDGHAVDELLRTYKSVRGVNKSTSAAWFNITPASVLAFASSHNLPVPAWAEKVAA